MKKLFFVVAIALTIISCRQRQSTHGSETDPIVMEDSVYMINDSTFGELQTYTYEGTIPAADGPGIQYKLIIQRDGPDKNGKFTLHSTYIDADNNENKTFTDHGNAIMIDGRSQSQNAMFIQLVSDKGNTTNFVIDGDTALTMVNEDFKRHDTNLNYTIKRTN